MSAEILPVIYRDDWLVAVHKPAGLLVHRSEIDRHETRFALQIVRDQLGQKVWSSHRLDKPTSGLLLLGLTPEAGRALSMAFEAQAVDKQYLAVVRGWPDAAGTIDHPLARIVDAMAAAARTAGVQVVTGDTKVVEKGKGDGVFITTTGVGALPAGRNPGGAQARPGDAVLVSGTLGDHGMAILAQRESLAFESQIVSDSAALNGLVEALYAAVPAEAIHVLRDPTRGGLGTTLNEIASQAGVGILIEERQLPITAAVAALFIRSDRNMVTTSTRLRPTIDQKPAGVRRATSATSATSMTTKPPT